MNPKEPGYTNRMKKKWDSLHPELNIFTAKHLNTQITRVIKKKLIRETGFDEAAQPKEQNSRSNRRKVNSKNEDGGNHNQTSHIENFNSIPMVQAPTTQEPSQQSEQQEVLPPENKNYGINGKNILTYSAWKI